MNLRPPPRRVLVLVAVVAAVGAGVGLAANDGSPTSKQVVSPTTAVAAHVQPNAQQRRLGNQGPPMTFAPRGDLLGPTGGDLSAAEIGIAQTAFENDAFLRSMFRQANISDPEILYIHRVALNPTEAKNPVGEGSIAAVYTREQRDFVIPSGRNIVLWDTRNVRSSRPEGYDVIVSPGIVHRVTGVVVFVDLRLGQVIGIDPNRDPNDSSGYVEQFPDGYVPPNAVTLRAQDLQD